MTVELITAATPEIHEAMGRLIPQLSRSAAPMSEADVQRFLSQDSVHLFAFRPDEADAQGNRPILGMLSLVTFEIPTGVRAWIEDVVVDEAARSARVIVPDFQLSLAIGKEGQNARLAAKLTGWRIDIVGDGVTTSAPGR